MKFQVLSVFVTLSCIYQSAYGAPFGFSTFNVGVDLFKTFVHLTANQIWVDVYNDIKLSNYSESCRESAVSFHQEVSTSSPDTNFRHGKFDCKSSI